MAPVRAGFKSMTVVSVEHALAGKLPAGGEVTVRGWVHPTRFKAGLSFVNVSDGSCFAAIRWSRPPRCPTTNPGEAPHRRLRGDRHRHAGALAGRGQSFGAGRGDRGRGLGRGSETYPIQPKAHSLEFLREVAHLRPRTNLFGAVARIRDRLRQGRAPLFPRTGLLLDLHADHHHLRRRRRRADVPRLHPGHAANLPRDGEGKNRLRPRFLRRNLPHRLRPAQRRGLLPGAEQGLHLRPDLPAPRTATPRATWPSSG